MTAAASGLAAETTSATIKTAVVIQAANLGPRTSTVVGWVLLLLDTVLLLDMPVALKTACYSKRTKWRRATARFRGSSECYAGVRGYSAATATTTARGAAQIDCATLGEHGLKAGWHVGQLT
jgi:hypothetical protein